ncbi:FAD/NAD(P)-binding domain-containing protein [Thozetella sp. PMI_491]|nr:FAD/NAD(P)-binding domain-containing protein [Thozetella sp. PMI_491]
MAPYTILLALASFPAAISAARGSFSGCSDVIEKDVVIVGGGAAGSHAAVRLREDFNKSVILIEREAILGGHVDTYYDPEAKAYRDFGVQVYFPYMDAMDFIARFNLTLVQGLAPRGSTTTRYVDFSSGQTLVNYTTPNATLQQAAVVNFYNALVDNGYDKMVEPGFWNLPPGPQIPADLLLPISEFAAKYNATPALGRIFEGTGGGVGSRGNFSNALTLTVLQSFSPAYLKVFLGKITYYHIQDGNQGLYTKIAAHLGNDVLFNTTVMSTERSDTGVKVVVSNEKGTKTIHAKKLLLAIPPTRENLASFDLNAAEKEHFSKPQYGRYHTAVVKHSKLPEGVQLRNMPQVAVKHAYSSFLDAPFVLSFASYGNNTSAFSIGTSGPDYNRYTEQAAAAVAQGNLEKMAGAGTLPNLQGEKLQVLDWSDHGPGGYGVSAAEMRAGWMSQMYGLQGKRSTWFTGNAIAIDFSTTLWKFNDDLITRILSSW